MKATDLHQVERNAICNAIERHHIMTAPETVEIEIFCDVLSDVLERLAKGDHAVNADASQQQV